MLPEIFLRFVNGVFRSLDLCKFFRIAVICVDIITCYNELRTVCFRKSVHVFQHCRFCPVVRIHKIKIFSSGDFNRLIPRTRRAAVLFMNHLDSAVFCSVFVANFPASIRCSVVHNNKFKIFQRLGKDTFNCLSDIFFYVIYRHDYTNAYFLFLILH